MQAVCYLDKNDPDVVRHGEQQLLEVLCLCRSAVTEDSTGYFSQSVHNLGDLRTKDILDVFHCVISVLYHIMQQGCTYRSGTETYFIAYNAGNGNRVHNIRFARTAFDTFMRLIGKVESLRNDFNLFAMFSVEIIIQ